MTAADPTRPAGGAVPGRSGGADGSADVVIGVIIEVPEPHATVLRGWRQRIGDPQAETIPPHVTLLPPTRVDEAALPMIDKHLSAAAGEVSAFPMHLSGTGTFRPVSQVVFVQVGAGIGECELLQQAIRCGPLDRDLDFPYHPHVTVAHDLDPAALDAAYDGMSAFIARFAVDSFGLLARGADGHWTPLASYDLPPAGTRSDGMRAEAG